MPLSEMQAEALKSYLTRNQRTCPECGRSEWKFGEIQLPMAGLYLDHEKVEPSREFVEIVCESCGHPEAVDCIEAHLPEE